MNRLLFSIFFCFFFNFFSLESASNVSVFNLCVCVFLCCMSFSLPKQFTEEHECTIEKKLKLLKDNSPHIFPFLLLIYSCHKTETENDFTDYFLMFFFLLHFSQVKNFFFLSI